MSILVSILIPCFNAEPYIIETLNSVLTQSYENWECIIVDDNSTDDSVDIIKSFVAKYPNKFTLLNNPRKGACAARNFATEKSKGGLIQYLDADDILHPQKIGVQVNLLSQEKTLHTVACGVWAKFNTSIKKIGQHDFHPNNLLKSNYTPLDWIKINPLCQTATWLIPKIIIEKAGLWDEKLHKNQDGEFFTRIIANSNKISFSPSAYVFYRTGITNSITAKLTQDKIYSSYLTCISFEKTVLEKFEKSFDIKTEIANRYINYCYIYGSNISEYNFNQAIAKAKEYGGGTIKPFQNKTMNFLNNYISTVTLLKFRYFVIKK